ncbi:hypothetical protein OS31_40420 [Dickeya oryzae]
MRKITHYAIRHRRKKITAQLEGLKYTRAEPNGWTCKTLAHGRVTDDVAESWNGAIDAAILTIADWDALRQAQQKPDARKNIQLMQYAKGLEKAATSLHDTLSAIAKARPGGTYFNKWDNPASEALSLLPVITNN